MEKKFLDFFYSFFILHQISPSLATLGDLFWASICMYIYLYIYNTTNLTCTYISKHRPWQLLYHGFG